MIYLYVCKYTYVCLWVHMFVSTNIHTYVRTSARGDGNHSVYWRGCKIIRLFRPWNRWFFIFRATTLVCVVIRRSIGKWEVRGPLISVTGILNFIVGICCFHFHFHFHFRFCFRFRRFLDWYWRCKIGMFCYI